MCRVDQPVVVLVSLDGFRAEYMSRNLTPTLQALRQCGVHVPQLRPIYPSKTYVNHYTIATVNKSIWNFLVEVEEETGWSSTARKAGSHGIGYITLHHHF